MPGSAQHVAVPPVIGDFEALLARARRLAEVRALLDEVWYIDLSEETRLAWLTQHHLDYGMSWEAARTMSLGSDQRNAELVAATRQHPDVLVRLDALRFPQHLDHNQRW